MSRANEGRQNKISAERNGVIACTEDSRPLKKHKAVYNNSTDFVSSVTTEKLYTSFKWKLNEYSFLEEYLTTNLSSPKFLITNTNKQCQLSIQKRKEMIELYVTIPESIPCQILQIGLSIIDENDTKVKKSCSFVYPFTDRMSRSICVNVMQITANEIFSNEKYLVNDTLTLLCEIVTANIVHVSEADVHSVNLAHFDKSSCHKLEEYYSTKAFSDIDLFVIEKQFRAHKLILATASPVFEAMFRTDMLETEKNSVRITDIDADVFEKFLQYLYVGKVENLDQVAVDLLIVAGKYQVSGLMDQCESFLISTVDISNAVERLFLAHQHSFKKLKDVALQFVRSNIHSLAEENNFKELCVCSDLFAEVFSKPK